LTLSDFERSLSSSHQLPGHKAFELLGLQRKEPNANELLSARKAAVSIIVTLANERPKILFIKRSNYKGVHSSQMAFPGGKFEDVDSSMLECAKRETLEEIGLDLTAINPIKELSSIYIPPSRFLVQPYVFIMPSLDVSSLKLESDEVQSVHFLNADILNTPAPFIPKKLNLETQSITTKGIVLDNEFVWGASAAMLAEIHHILINK
jgi:8-oxo-dGTP pyrophosphatase MutT (NUDIX family)